MLDDIENRSTIYLWPPECVIKFRINEAEEIFRFAKSLKIFI